MIKNIEFSVLMPIYFKEKSEYFQSAIESILNQTLLPNEILIIEDGKIPDDLEKEVLKYKDKYPDIINILRLEKNIGIGKVRALAMEKCKYDYIAFADSDDISRNDRFEKQIKFLSEHPETDVLGSDITEFDGVPENIYSKRMLPSEHSQIYQFNKYRMGINNNTVILKRKSVLDAGNYGKLKAFEDYELYSRMLKKGYKFANIPECLVNMRAGAEMMNRRQGVKYFVTCELPCMNEMFKIGYINIFEYLRNIFLKFLLRVIPNWLRNWIYKKFLRN